MKRFAWSFVLVGAAVGSGLRAQAPKRLPVIAGNGMVNYGALGDGGYAGFTAKPHPPTGLGPVLVHYMSGGSSYAIRADGTVMAWCIPTTSGNALFVLVPTAVFTVKLSE